MIVFANARTIFMLFEKTDFTIKLLKNRCLVLAISASSDPESFDVILITFAWESNIDRKNCGKSHFPILTLNSKDRSK